jgi:hypothetical protein
MRAAAVVSVMGMFRQESPEPNLRLVVDFLYIHKDFVGTGACDAKDFALAFYYRPDDGPE